MTYRRINTGEKRHSAPNLQADDLSELIDVVRFTLGRPGGVVTLSGENTKEGDRFQKVTIGTVSEFVTKDTKTGYFLKGSDAKTATAQYETMNYLSAESAERGLGIRAVRHAYMLIPENEWVPTVSIVEPAPGKSIYSMFIEDLWSSDGTLDTEVLGQYDDLVAVTKNRLDKILPTNVRQLLASDLHGNNIFTSDGENYTIIDQPSPDYNDEVLRWFERQSQSWFKKILSR